MALEHNAHKITFAKQAACSGCRVSASSSVHMCMAAGCSIRAAVSDGASQPNTSAATRRCAATSGSATSATSAAMLSVRPRKASSFVFCALTSWMSSSSTRTSSSVTPSLSRRASSAEVLLNPNLQNIKCELLLFYGTFNLQITCINNIKP